MVSYGYKRLLRVVAVPIRPLSRERTWLFPPTLEELIPSDHPARFVAAFVEELDRATWAKLEVAVDGDPLGAPSYDPRALLCVWLYGFMTGVRSSRKLEAACRDQVPYLWLTGWEHPDHNTLWRFYQAHRQPMRELFKRTIRTAVHSGLVDLAVQAVDGTRIGASAARAHTHDRANLERLLKKTDAVIADLEAQNATGEDPPPPRLPEELAHAEALRNRVRAAIQQIDHGENAQSKVNLTDPDATIQKNCNGYLVGYNAQAMVSAVGEQTAGCTGLLITAADVTTDADDHGQLAPLIDQAQETTGQLAGTTLADAGYHSGPNLQACAERGQIVVMPEAQQKKLEQPYHKQAFRYDEETDTFRCPAEQILRYVRTTHRQRRPWARLYRPAAGVCAVCPAFATCAKNRPAGRTIETGPEEQFLRAHRAWMATVKAKESYRLRKQMPEPTFGILKEQQGARRFLLRGLAQVRAEWLLLATAFNLRTLYQVWVKRKRPRLSELPGAPKLSQLRLAQLSLAVPC
jgi:transposase